jgi:redox-sensitive bicupin YhaK (pirin superfamily)
MSDVTAEGIERCPQNAAAAPTVEVLPGHHTDLGGLVVRRLLPRSARRLVGAWCFLDAYGPVPSGGGPAMDVPPHPHIGIQTVSWVLAGEVLHKDSLGAEAVARPGTLNLMTSGRGIAHSEETARDRRGPLHGIQLWVALPDSHRNVEPAFDAYDDLPTAEVPGGRAHVFLGELGGVRSPARVFTPIVGADVAVGASGRTVVPLERSFEHAVVVIGGQGTLDGQPLAPDTLYYLGTGRSELCLDTAGTPLRLLLIGGAPFGETILMWWNFVARTTEEIVVAREDWQAGRRFGEVKAYAGDRLEAPPFLARPVRANPAS